MDGLTLVTSTLSHRVHEMAERYEKEIEMLKRQIAQLKSNGYHENGSQDQVSIVLCSA